MTKFYKKKKTTVRVSWVLIYALFFNAALPFSVFAESPAQAGAGSVKYVDTGYVDDNRWIEQCINSGSGNNFFTETRLSVSCPGTSLELDLTYESISSHPDTGIGSHWTHSYEWVLVDDDSGKALHTGNGSKYIFEAVSGGYDSPDGLNWTLQAVPSGYAVQLPGGEAYLFESTGRLDAIADAWGNRIQCSYDVNGCLQTVQHDNGRQMIFTNTWSSALEEWRVESVTVPNGASLAFSYDLSGQPTQIVEQVGNNSYTSVYAYADGLLTNRVDAAGFSYAYDYEPGSGGKCTSLSVDGNLTHEVDYVDSDVTDIISTMRGLEQRFRYSRNSEGTLETKQGPAPNTTDLQSRGTRYEYATNNVDQTEETIFDNNTGATWSKWMLYDDAHNMTNLSVGYNTTNRTHQMSVTYDADWQLPSVYELADGARTEIVYTNGSPAVEKTFYSPSQSFDTTYAYTTNGLLRSITKANESVIELEYDDFGNLIAILPEIGPSLTNSYNARGDIERLELLAESGASTGRIYQFGTDANRRLTELVFPDGLTSTYAYNGLGMMTNNVDRAGRATETTYGPTGQKTSVTKYLNQNGSNVPVRVSYNFDEQFNTLSITEPCDRYVESYQLDIQNRVTAVTNIEGQVMTLGYSVGNFVTEINRFDGSQIECEYDQAGRLIDSKYVKAGILLVSVSRTYWPDSQLKTIADDTSTVSNNYDRLNRLTNSLIRVDSSNSWAVSYSHDPVGNLTNSVVSIGNSASNSLTTEFSYDPAERLIGISQSVDAMSSSRSFSYAYNPENGRISSITNLESGIVTTYAYDLMDHATNISYRTSTGALIRSLDYEFDAVGMITGKKISGPGNTVSYGYAYDSIDRLISESRTAGVSPAWSASYRYDLAGNRLSKTSNGWKTDYTLGIGNRLDSATTAPLTNAIVVSGSSSESIGTDDRWGALFITNLTAGSFVVPSVNGASFSAEIPSIGNTTNTLVAAIRDCAGNMGYATNSIFVEIANGANLANQTFQYDAAGCLVSNLTVSTVSTNLTIFTWDERYRLTSVDEASSLVSYTYDVLGRRVSRSVVGGGDPGSTNVEYYVYNDNQIAADLDSSNNVLRTYVWGQGVDNLLSMTICPASTVLTNSTPLTLYPIKDHQNSVLAFVDERGSVVESYDYDAWGNAKVFDASGTELTESAIGNRYTFQGREIDWATGLIYFRARWYDPVTGRWLSKDSIGIAGGLNQYVFCANNPVNFVDPFGENAGQDLGSGLMAVGLIIGAWSPHAGAIIGGTGAFIWVGSWMYKYLGPKNNDAEDGDEEEEDQT